MQSLLIAIFSATIIFTGLYRLNWDSPVSTNNIQTTSSKEVAENIYDYAYYVKQYAQTESIISEVIQDSRVTPYITYQFSKLGNYQSVILTDINNNTYEIVTWSSLYKSSVNLQSVAGQLTLLSSEKRGFNGTSWYIPLIIKNTNCMGEVLNGNLKPIMQNLAGYTQLFNTLCNQSISTGLNLGKYVLLIQIN